MRPAAGFAPVAPPLVPLGLLHRLARRLVTQQLSGITHGQIVLSDSCGTLALGNDRELRASLRVHRPRLFSQALLGGTLSVAESYLQGDWDCDDLTSLFRIFLRNPKSTERLDSGWARLKGLSHRLFHR